MRRVNINVRLALVERWLVEGSVGQGAQRAIMTLDPHALAADSVRIAEERNRALSSGDGETVPLRADERVLLSAVGNGIATGIR